MGKVKKELLAIILLLFLSYPSIKSLLVPGGYTSHDLTHHVVRQISMHNLLSEGQFPPRWSGNLNNGYGYPTFIFIYPLPALLGEVFHETGLNYVESVKAVMLFSMLSSVVGMYLFLRELFGKKARLAVFLGAIFFLYAPVRFLNVYVSAAVGNALALGILPFIFWSLVKLSKGARWGILTGSLSLAALVAAHNVTTLMFAPVILVFSLYLLLNSKNPRQLFLYFAATALFGAGISAFFWLPALIEKQYIIYNEVLPRFWADHFPTLKQLIRSPWGYGFSKPGLVDGLSFQIGLIHIFVVGLLSISFWFYRKKKEFAQLSFFSLTFFVTSIFLMLEISLPLWDSVPLLGFVQFPGRFLAVAVFSASIAATLLVYHLPFKKLLFLFLLVLVLYANRNHLRVNLPFNPGEDFYLSQQTTTTMAGEHLPRWGRIPPKPSSEKLSLLEGEAEITLAENKSHKVAAHISSKEDIRLRFNQFYFPGWTIKANGQNVDFNYLEEGENRGLPVFELPAGEYKLEANFTKTPVRKTADAASLTALIVWIGSFILLTRGNPGAFSFLKGA